ncbi:MAG: hypothetical protein K2X93_05695 [Candidatus Obscuribacterales bacterium]|nr:hypothetical protein [Candidatus Obscuribacterales bacterium]
MLIWKQAEFARYVSGVTYEEPTQENMASYPHKGSRTVPLLMGVCADQNFTGGVIGLPGHETIVLPKQWIETLSEQQASTELTRRHQVIEPGSRTRGVIVAIVFNSVGILLSAFCTSLTTGVPLDTAAGLLSISLCFTIWSFIGLLILPRYSHAGVVEADYLALRRVVDAELLEETIRK